MENNISKEELQEVFENNNIKIATDRCNELSLELDKSQLSKKICLAIDSLEMLPKEEAIQIIKSSIGIDRIIKHNLDNTIFGDLLKKLNT